MPSEGQLQTDLQTAMKAREMEKVYILRGLISAIKNLKIEKQISALAESDIVALVRKEINKRTEAADFARQANRPDLIAQNESEKAVLAVYLPQQLSAEALESVLRALATELGSTQIGPLMTQLRERYAGQFDGKLASEIIRKISDTPR